MLVRMLKTMIQLVFVIAICIGISIVSSIAFAKATEEGFSVDLPDIGFEKQIEKDPDFIGEDELSQIVSKVIIELEHFVNDLEVWINETLVDSEKMTIATFVIVFWLFSIFAVHSSSMKQYTLMSHYTLGIGTKIANKVISFNKPWWFWLLCLVTFFLPILIPCWICLVIKLIALLLHFLLAPVSYVILSYANSTNS